MTSLGTIDASESGTTAVMGVLAALEIAAEADRASDLFISFSNLLAECVRAEAIQSPGWIKELPYVTSTAAEYAEEMHFSALRAQQLPVMLTELVSRFARMHWRDPPRTIAIEVLGAREKDFVRARKLFKNTILAIQGEPA